MNHRQQLMQYIQKHRQQISGYRKSISEPDDSKQHAPADFYRYIKKEAIASFRKKLPGIRHVMTRGFGSTLKHDSRSSWASFFEDPSVPGSFRYQLYDANGFFSHGTYPSLIEAVCEATSMGYRIPDDAAADTVMRLKSFEMGNRLNSIIADSNRNAITWTEAIKRADAVRAEYA